MYRCEYMPGNQTNFVVISTISSSFLHGMSPPSHLSIRLAHSSASPAPSLEDDLRRTLPPTSRDNTNHSTRFPMATRSMCHANVSAKNMSTP